MANSKLEQLHERELVILKEVLRIVHKYDLRYFALGGTLLGAVRHKGFIPWDDDIDIGMPRKDYELFLQVCNEELPDSLKAVYYKSQDRNEKNLGYTCQVKDLDTEIEMNIANTVIHANVWIDIFPLDGMPDNIFVRKLHSLVLLYRRMRKQFSMFDEQVHQHRKNRPIHERLLIWLYNITKIGSKSDPHEMLEKLDKSLRKYPYDDCNYLINMMGAWKLKEMFPKAVYGTGKTYKFEDMEINGPEDADYVLKQMYGDYMTPIGQADRESHHRITIKKV